MEEKNYFAIMNQKLQKIEAKISELPEGALPAQIYRQLSFEIHLSYMLGDLEVGDIKERLKAAALFSFMAADEFADVKANLASNRQNESDK
ncbi:MAG: hypothetical protein F6K39_40790 [Okeania sp. SIO3B3]|nr:hypothetical protein [Okeania sp. SIO3B3]